MIKQRVCLAMKYYSFFLYTTAQRNQAEFRAVLEFFFKCLLMGQNEGASIQVELVDLHVELTGTFNEKALSALSLITRKNDGLYARVDQVVYDIIPYVMDILSSSINLEYFEFVAEFIE